MKCDWGDRVVRGAAVLDERDPEWYTKIDPETLTVSSAKKCVLSQVFGSWSAGKLAANVDPTTHGFSCFQGSDEKLRRLWTAEVEKRAA